MKSAAFGKGSATTGWRLPSVGIFRSLRTRLLFWILVVATPIYAGAIFLSYQSTAKRLEANAIREADQLAAELVAGLDAVIRPIEGGIRTVAYQLEAINPPRSEYLERIRGVLGAWPDIYGSTIALEVSSRGADSAFAPYLFRAPDGTLGYSDLASDSYGYRALPWYRVAADARHPVWSAPYFDTGGGETWMVTYSMPFYSKSRMGGRVFAGIVTADLDLQWVQRTAAASKLGAIGMGWMYPAEVGTPFVAPVGETATRIAQFDQLLDVAGLRAAGESMLARNIFFAELPAAVSARPAYLAVRNLSTLGWQLALVIPRDELLAEAHQLLNRQLALGALGLLFLIAAVYVVATGITRPIRELAGAVGAAGTDGLDFELPVARRRDELGVLAAALLRLRDSLQQHVEMRAASLTAQARMDQELEVSAQIQQSMLPHGDSLHALPVAVEIAVALKPARQVGGDLYDFFPLHDGKVLFAVGDVSDKGIPAALFMAQLSALLRVLGANGNSPEHLLSQINGRLSEGNDACMFVTAGCGILDPETGAFRYSSAGHESPLLRRLEGDVVEVAVDNGSAIGIELVATYPLQQGVIAPGDTLLLFTDGVTEAETADGEMFGTERLITLVRHSDDGDPAAMIQRIVEQLTGHADGFHATDDLTAMAIRYQPADVATRRENDGAGWEIQVTRSAAGIETAQQRLRGILQARGISAEQQHDVELVAEEWLTNVVRSARALSAPVSMDLLLTTSELVLTFRDDNAAFNPLEAAEPDLDADIADRPIGGLGILLVRQLADSCHYSRIDDCNLLQVRINRQGI